MLNKTDGAKQRARKLRSEMSVSEQWFWEAVRRDRLGYRFRRQVPIGPYVLDFYVPAAKLCIEIDGEQHAERALQDLKRDAYLNELGIQTIRIPSLDLFNKDEDRYTYWLQEVKRACASRSPNQ